MKEGRSARSSIGYPVITISGSDHELGSGLPASRQASRPMRALPARSPTVGLTWREGDASVGRHAAAG